MSWRPKWQNLGARDWSEIRGSWLANVPNFPAPGARPDGLEHLVQLSGLTLPQDKDYFADIQGIRAVALWEAVFLFHKCSHTHLATQRMAWQGMQSWSLFNAYHSAYLGARGIMALLGIALPNLSGTQIAVDLFPVVSGGKGKRRILAQGQFQEFLILRLPKLIEQRYLWEAFQRTVRMTKATCWDGGLRQELLEVSYEDFSRPRNGFIYKVPFWPLDDLMEDADYSGMSSLLGTDLDVDDNRGFLLRLSFLIYTLFHSCPRQYLL
jgi:hypothetical protein